MLGDAIPASGRYTAADAAATRRCHAEAAGAVGGCAAVSHADPAAKMLMPVGPVVAVVSKNITGQVHEHKVICITNVCNIT